MAVYRTENRYRNAIKPLKNTKPVLNTRLGGNHRLDNDLFEWSVTCQVRSMLGWRQIDHVN